MDRLFKRSNFAKVSYLNKMWDFKVDPNNEGITEKWFSAFPTDTRKMVVPSCWNNEIDLFRYTGTAWYKTDFDTNSANIYIKFEGVANECDVYIDGEHIGYHYGGFVEFGFEVNGLVPGSHELVLRVNNTLNYNDTIPLPHVDWFNYGGITRQIEVRELSDAWIRSYQIDYTLSGELSDASVRVSASLKTFAPKSDELEIFVNDEKLYSVHAEVDGEAEFTAEFKLSDIKLWDIFKPNLYYIKIRYGNEDIIDRIGFREIKTEHKNILLNGRPIKILGVNRHEEHPDFGFSMPFSLIKKDIDIIKSMNCNAVRTSHYPNTKKTADYCDEIGMLFWDEIPMWGYFDGRRFEALKNELLLTRALSMNREMIARDRNHPSIIVWCMQNECATHTEECHKFLEEMTKLTRSLDSSRLVTYVSMVCSSQTPDICYDLADIVCLNRYIAWYNEVESDTWDLSVSRMRETLKKCNSEDKPFIMSEFGAGAIYGVNTFEAQRWTEDYQADCLEYCLTELLENEELCGTYIWQYCDIRTSQLYELSRPRSFNNKGILDEYRRPKRAFRTVQRIYGKYLPEKKAEPKRTWLAGYKTVKI